MNDSLRTDERGCMRVRMSLGAVLRRGKMKPVCLAKVAAMVLVACCSLSATYAKYPAGFNERFAEVNEVHLPYLIGGKGSPVILLHDYTETSHMWR